MDKYWELEYKLADIADNMGITKIELNRIIPELPKDMRYNIHSIILEQIHILKQIIMKKGLRAI